MRSPPSSTGLFFSSPPHSPNNGPEDEVQTLLASAQKITALDNNLLHVIGNNKEQFLNVFSRQIQLLRSRSQALEDAHVTVYDKVLLLLTKNGNDLENPAAIAWYCAEYLGFNTHGDIEHNTCLIDQALAVPTALSQGLQPRASTIVLRTKTNEEVLTPLPSRKNSEVIIEVGHIKDRPLVNSDVKEDPKFAHLWSVYSKAHSDYLALANKRDGSSLEAAKFLRDTAENGIHYLKDRYPQDPALTELNSTYTMAKFVVLNLNGGRKRKFDRTNEASEKHPPHTVHHNRANAERRRHKKNTQNSQGRGKKNHRGPSGIPYGYTRPVDSYYPA